MLLHEHHALLLLLLLLLLPLQLHVVPAAAATAATSTASAPPPGPSGMLARSAAVTVMVAESPAVSRFSAAAALSSMLGLLLLPLDMLRTTWTQVRRYLLNDSSASMGQLLGAQGHSK